MPSPILSGSVTYEPSPIMPIDHELWSPPIDLPPALKALRTCFHVTVDHNSPAA